MAEVEDESIVTEGRGSGQPCAPRRLRPPARGGRPNLQYHFEFLSLGYGAYLALLRALPEGVSGDHGPDAREDGGGDRRARPTPRRRAPAARRLAVELGVSEQVAAPERERARPPSRGSDAGERWLADFEGTKEPWFYFSCGTGSYHHHRSWIDDTTFPILTIGSYIGRLAAGEDISRPREAVLAERERVTGEHRALLPEELRAAFDESSRSPGRCSPTSRTTTSTSTTAT